MSFRSIYFGSECDTFAIPTLSLQQPLTARLNVDHLLRRVNGEDNVVRLADQDLIFNPNGKVVKCFGKVRMRWDSKAWLDGLRMSGLKTVRAPIGRNAR